MCVVFSQSGFPTTASCYTSFLCSSKTDSFRLGQSLIIARSSFPICAVTAMQHYFQLAASPPGSLFSFQSSRLLTRSAVFPCYGILRVLQGFLFIFLKVTVFALVPPLQPLLRACQTGGLNSWVDGPQIEHLIKCCFLQP